MEVYQQGKEGKMDYDRINISEETKEEFYSRGWAESDLEALQAWVAMGVYTISDNSPDLPSFEDAYAGTFESFSIFVNDYADKPKTSMTEDDHYMDLFNSHDFMVSSENRLHIFREV